MTSNLVQQQNRLNADMPLVLFTDGRDADWAQAARGLPHGSLVVVRGKTTKARAVLAQTLHGIAALLIADDPLLAAEYGVGLHLPQKRLAEAMHWRCRHPNWIITGAAHDLRAVWSARQLDAIFLSPVFATQSHPDARPLGPLRAAGIAAQGRIPVYALGGVTAATAARLSPGFDGIAAISAWL